MSLFNRLMSREGLSLHNSALRAGDIKKRGELCYMEIGIELQFIAPKLKTRLPWRATETQSKQGFL